MQTSRRSFLKKTALTLAGTSMLTKGLFAAPASPDVLGIQLYSVRDDMAKDPPGVLKQLSSMGYRYVEHANYINRKFYGYSATDFKKLLDGLQLKMLSGHTVMGKQHWDDAKKDFTDAWKWTVEDAATVGQHYVISPWLDENLRKSYDDLKKFLDLFNKSGELCKKHGMKFGYHNHNFEFSQEVNGKKVFDIIMDSIDPQLVAMQFDIGNMFHVGTSSAIDILHQYPGRFELMHVKDEIKTTGQGEMGAGYESTVLGAGIMSTKDIVDLARRSGGTHHFIVEQESYQGKTPLECAKEDFMAMKKWGF